MHFPTAEFTLWPHYSRKQSCSLESNFFTIFQIKMLVKKAKKKTCIEWMWCHNAIAKTGSQNLVPESQLKLLMIKQGH